MDLEPRPSRPPPTRSSRTRAPGAPSCACSSGWPHEPARAALEGVRLGGPHWWPGRAILPGQRSPAPPRDGGVARLRGLSRGADPGCRGLRVQHVRLSYRLDALGVARTELEEARNRLRVELATLKSLARIEGKAAPSSAWCCPPTIRFGSPVSSSRSATGLTSRAPLTAAAEPDAPRESAEASGSIGEESLARPDRHRPSAGFAGAICSRGRNRKGGGAPSERSAEPDARRRRLHRLRLRGPRRSARVSCRSSSTTSTRGSRTTSRPRPSPSSPSAARSSTGTVRPSPCRRGRRSLYALTSRIDDKDALARRLAPILGDSAQEDRQAARLSQSLRLRQAAPASRHGGGRAQSRRARPRLRRREHAPVSQPGARRPRGGIRGHGWQGPRRSRAGVGMSTSRHGGAGSRGARCARPRDHGRAQGDQAVHGGAGRDAHARRHAAVHRGEGGRRGVAAHAPRRRRSPFAMDPRTGDILALASARRSTRTASAPPPTTSAATSGVTDPFEPGSTFKVILAAAALEEGVVRPTDRFYAENGAIRVRTPRSTTTKVRLAHVLGGAPNSSNVGSIKVGLSLGKERYYKYISGFGFGVQTGVGLTGESRGQLRAAEAVVGTLARDHVDRPGDLGEPRFQMVSAVSAVANGGRLLQPQIVRATLDAEGRETRSRAQSRASFARSSARRRPGRLPRS